MIYKIKDSLYIENETQIIYKRIKHEYLDFRASNLDIFKLALAVGYKQSFRTPLLKKHRFIRTYNLNNDFNSLIWLIIIDEFGEDFHELADNPSRIYEIAEEYANTGILIIEDMLKKESDFYSILEKELYELYDINLIETLDNIK